MGKRLAVSLVLCAVLAAAVPSGSHPLLTYVVAHRGGPGEDYPENTLVTFRRAKSELAQHGRRLWLELDLRLTSDGVPVAMHDATLDRTTDCTGGVHAMTATQVTKCNAAQYRPGFPFEPVPTFAQILAEGMEAGWRLVPELKGIPGEPGFEPSCASLASAVLGVIEDAQYPAEDVVLQSFWPPCLDRVAESGIGIKTMLLTASDTATALARIVAPNLPGAPAGFYLIENAAFAAVRAYEFSAPDHTTPDLNVMTVAAAHALGREVVVWTVNDLTRANALVATGLDGLMSDSLSLLSNF